MFRQCKRTVNDNQLDKATHTYKVQRTVRLVVVHTENPNSAYLLEAN